MKKLYLITFGFAAFVAIVSLFAAPEPFNVWAAAGAFVLQTVGIITYNKVVKPRLEQERNNEDGEV